ncbi:CDP-glycerol glycerophosphotransferase family protein [Promicromonospora sukumoe]|uniref:CDP-glycerol glycerophosphotransferase family protein n=1 Tax=Promicromonospora sukumoe TaxID=88382 RepID=UPI0003A8379D|nr:CDP-glycerol glycerophosphotransferase family protein [Promicromonospora sukumoe]
MGREVKAGVPEQVREVGLKTVAKGQGAAAAAAHYRLAVLDIAAGRLSGAQMRLEHALAIDDSQAMWHHKLGFVQERRKRYADALASYERALAMDPAVAERHYRAGRCLQALRNRGQAMQRFETAVVLDPQHVRAAAALYEMLDNSVPLWRKHEILDLVAPILDSQDGYTQQLRVAHDLGRDEDVLRVVTRLEKSHQADSRTYLLAGLAAERLGRTAQARRELEKACRLDGDTRTTVVGPGIFFERQGDWREAAKRFVARWNEGVRDAELAFKAGYAFERQYLWDEAVEWFDIALGLDARLPYRHYKRAFALERAGHLSAAIRGYAAALELGGRSQRDWFYRLGSCLLEDERPVEALDVLLRFAGADDLAEELAAAGDGVDGSSGGDLPERPDLIGAEAASAQLAYARSGVDILPTDPNLWLRLAELLSSVGDLVRADEAYLEHERRAPEIDLRNRARHAVVMARLGQYVAACRLLLAGREFAQPDGLPLGAVTSSDHARRRALYVEYSERYEVAEKTVLFESYWGDKVACNPLAIYRAMVRDARYQDHSFVWVVKADTEVPIDVRSDRRTVLATYGSELHVRSLATAGALVNNTSFVDYFTRRPGQLYLNTWHGTPLKTLGKRIGTGVAEYANVARNLRNTTSIIAPNVHTRDVLVHDYDLDVTYRGSADAVGSPRLDALVVAGEPERRAALDRLGLEVGPGERVVFYAPTWRGGGENRTIDAESVVKDLTAMGSVPGTVVLYRVHHMVEAVVGDIEVPAIKVPADIDTYDVLPCVDVMVTDYSSLMFDFLVTGRQVILYTPDLEEYVAERGVYFRPDEVFDDVVGTRPELQELLGRTGPFEPGPRYEESRRRFTAAEDGKAAARCLDLIIRRHEPAHVDTTVQAEPGAEPIVFFSSLIPNGISTSLLNLLTHLDRSRYQPALLMEPGILEQYPDRLETLAKVPSDVSLITRNGAMVVSVEERWLVDRFTKHGYLSEPQWEIVRRGYRRELRRLLGTTRPVTLVEFEGYSTFWMSLLAAAEGAGHRSYAFLHNEMLAEKDTKYPSLEAVFQQYRDFTGLASVSTATAELNGAELEAAGYLRGKPMAAVHNALDHDQVVARAGEADELPAGLETHEGPLVVVVGRFSREKNQVDAIRAMKRVLGQRPDARLAVVGSGPLEGFLKTAAVEAGIAASVVFTGQLANPMPLMKRADVFVMTSTHEGQPQVLFEAMILGTPIVTYPTPGIREAVELGYGRVVEPAPEALAEAVLETLDGTGGAAGTFDAVAFNLRARAEFDDLVHGASQS